MSLFEDGKFFNEPELINDLIKAKIIGDPYRGTVKTYKEYLELHTEMLKIIEWRDVKIYENISKYAFLINKIKNLNDLKNLFQILFDLPYFSDIFCNRYDYGKTLYELFHKHAIYFKSYDSIV
jgi:hypothetical protein